MNPAASSTPTNPLAVTAAASSALAASSEQAAALTGAGAQTDLKALMRASPGLQMLPPAELEQLVNSVDTLPPANRQAIFEALNDEQKQLQQIQAEYDEKRRVLFDQYTTDLKNEEMKMARELRQQMEGREREKEARILEGLLAQLEKL